MPPEYFAGPHVEGPPWWLYWSIWLFIQTVGGLAFWKLTGRLSFVSVSIGGVSLGTWAFLGVPPMLIAFPVALIAYTAAFALFRQENERGR